MILVSLPAVGSPTARTIAPTGLIQKPQAYPRMAQTDLGQTAALLLVQIDAVNSALVRRQATGLLSMLTDIACNE